MKQEDGPFQTFDFFIFLWKYRIPILIVTFAGMIFSVIISLLIPSKYASDVVLYPSASSSVSKTLISTQWTGSKDILSFGDEEETERLLQILQSDHIRDRLVQKFNLYKHYDINPETKYKNTELQEKLKKNISFRKTEYMAVRIRVLDQDPKIAAEMANTIAVLLDSTITLLQKQKAVKAFFVVKKAYVNLQKEGKQMQDSIQNLSNLGIYDLPSQSKGLYEAYAEAIRKGDKSSVKELQRQMQVLASYGGTFSTLKNRMSYYIGRLSNLRIKYAEAKVDAEQDLPHIYIVKKAEVPDKKAVPKRSLIVIATTLSVFLFAVVLLLIFEAVKNRIK